MSSFAFSCKAFAKINLALHITDRRLDGYHILESVIAFANIYDDIHIKQAQIASLKCNGPFSSALNNEKGNDNLVLHAVDCLRKIALQQGKSMTQFDIELTKNLPVAAGLGGGSADAAAVLQAINTLWDLKLSNAQLTKLGQPLGADIPACIWSRPLIARGIGEDIELLHHFPEFGIILINSGQAIATSTIFKSLQKYNHPPLPPSPNAMENPHHVLSWLSACRNDLEAPALSHAPEIKAVLQTLKALPGVRLARMSGSGATCFALFDTVQNAYTALEKIDAPHWWVAAGKLTTLNL